MAGNSADRHLEVAELGKPLRAEYGLLKPLCVCLGQQWLLGPMWVMNIVTLGLILVPGFLWFSSVWATRTLLERILIAPSLFIGTLVSYAYTSWVDPGIVQPGHFAAIESKLAAAQRGAAARQRESLEGDIEAEAGSTLGPSKTHRGAASGSSKWNFNPSRTFSYTMRDCDNIEQRICPICGVPQPAGREVVHVSDVGACVEEYDHFCPWVNNAVGAKNTASFYWFLACVAMLLIYVMLTWSLANTSIDRPSSVQNRQKLNTPLVAGEQGDAAADLLGALAHAWRSARLLVATRSRLGARA